MPDDQAFYSGVQDGFGAGRRAAVMVARAFSIMARPGRERARASRTGRPSSANRIIPSLSRTAYRLLPGTLDWLARQLAPYGPVPAAATDP